MHYWSLQGFSHSWFSGLRAPLQSWTLCFCSLNTVSSHISILSLPSSIVDSSLLFSSSSAFIHFVLVFFFCQLLSPGHLSHLSSFYPHLPFSSIASHLLHISGYVLSLPLSSLFSLSPHGLVQMSDQTEQHDSQRRAEFPLVYQSISNRTVCRTLNHRWKHETLTDWLNCGWVRGQIVHKRTGKGFFCYAIWFPAWNGYLVWRQTLWSIKEKLLNEKKKMICSPHDHSNQSLHAFIWSTKALLVKLFDDCATKQRSQIPMYPFVLPAIG